MTLKKVDSVNNTKKMIFSITILSVVLVLLILLIIPFTRTFVYLIFGYSVYILIPVCLFFGLTIFFGKRVSFGWKKNLLISLFIVSLVSLFHVSFYKNGITGDPLVFLVPTGFITVGGLISSAIIYPLYAIFPNYGFLVASTLIITGILFLFLIFPLIKFFDKKVTSQNVFKNKVGKVEEQSDSLLKNKDNSITKNPLPNSLNPEAEPPLGALRKEEVEEMLLDAKTLLFGNDNNKQNVKERSFGGLVDRDEDRANQSARLLFSEDSIPKKEDNEHKYNIIDKEWSNDKLNSLYTNAGRRELLEQNQNSNFSTQYGPHSLNGDYPFENKDKNFKTNQSESPIFDSSERNASLENDKVSNHEKGLADRIDFTDPIQSDRGVFDEKEALKELHEPLSFEQSGFFQILKKPDETEEIIQINQENEKKCNVKNSDQLFSPKKDKPRGEEYSSQISIESINYGSNEKTNIADDLGKYRKEKKDIEVQTSSQTSIFDNKPTNTIDNYKYKPYKRPSVDLLPSYPGNDIDFPEDYNEVKQKIETTMAEFEIPAEVIGAKRGPTFTLYELKLGPGYQIAKIRSIKENLIMRLAIKQIRILTPIAGKDAFGLEIPNKKRDIVGLRSLISSPEFNSTDKGIRLCFGKTLDGTNFIEDLSSMPHLLVAGATGTGKSVFLNALIVSILYKYSPEDVRLILIDPKRVELAVYKNLPNLLIAETIKENAQAVSTLKWLTEEMDRRYKFFEEVGCANIDQYNNGFRDSQKEPKMYRIVLVIDEMADLMMKGKGQVETYVVRIAQLARACGIHMIIATQRPTVQVITGLIKANILSRVAFSVKSGMDSRVILDDPGAEDLLGNGDMIYSSTKGTTRMQGALVELAEIKKVCDSIRANNESVFNDDLLNAITVKPEIEETEIDSSEGKDEKADDFEEMLKQVMLHFIKKGKASISSAQATFGLGFLRAKKFVDALEARGYLGPETTGSQGRTILLTEEEFLSRFDQN